MMMTMMMVMFMLKTKPASEEFPTHPMTPPPGGWNPWEIRRNSWNPNVEILKYETHQTLPLTTLHSAQLHALYTESRVAWFLKIFLEPASLQTWYQIIARGNIRLHFFIEKITIISLSERPSCDSTPAHCLDLAQLCREMKQTSVVWSKGLFINDVINFGGYRDPPSPSSSFVTFWLPPSSRV